jgi:molybdate transport system substrate-binding protein
MQPNDSFPNDNFPNDNFSTEGDTMKRLYMVTRALLWLGLALGLTLRPGDADATDIKVLSTGNMQSILGALAGDFESATGHRPVIEYGSTPKMRDRIASGEAADLTINERYVLDDLLKQRRVEAGTLIDIARSPLGVGVRAGAAKPDISSPEAFKRALLAAESIAYPDPSGGAQDGTYFAGLIMRMGIADELKPKIKLTQGGDAAAQLVAAGGAQIGVAQRRNFNALKGVELLEPLPDIPGIKFLMVAGVVAGAHEHDGALAFAKFLSSPAVSPLILAKGMEPYAKLP